MKTSEAGLILTEEVNKQELRQTAANYGDHTEAPEPGQPVDIQVQLWRVLVKPLDADSKSKGGILFADETKVAQQFNTQVFEVLEVGACAYDGETKSGIPLHRQRRVLPGEFVICGALAGQTIEVKGGQKYRFITVDMILAITLTPDAFVKYV